MNSESKDLNVTYTVFSSLIDQLGFTEERIGSLDVSTVLVPSDQAFYDFILDAGGNLTKPAEFVKQYSDVFKQVRNAMHLLGRDGKVCPSGK